jgi:putative ABC transport system ATP-binding protein
MIKVKNLTRKFQMGDTELIAIRRLTFNIPKQQFVAITGKSGSGKSTLLYQLSLLDHPTIGEIMLNGQNMLGLTNGERVTYRLNNIGYIFQDYAILPTLTARENVMVPLLMRGLDPNTASEEASEALTKVGLEDKFDNLPSQLSGGQQQRVSIARSVVHKPQILFADEPTANLDTESSLVILDVFEKLHKEGQTIIMVTHEKEYAKKAERIIELRDGEIVSDRLVRKSKTKRKKKIKKST